MPTTQKKQLNKKRKVGRPTVMDKETVEKLVEVFKLDATVEEACAYAGINKGTYYRHLEKNPNFATKIQDSRQYLKIAARRTIGQNIHQPDMAKWYAERKISDEFVKKEKLEHTIKPEDRIKELMDRIDEKDTEPPKDS